MPRKRPHVLTVAGFDPSAGAGLLADIKTFESHKVYGLGACTALTVQNEDEFVSVEWIPKREILSQLEILLTRYKVEYVKIGLLQNLSLLESLVELLIDKEPRVKIIWDPILSASAGFEFHTDAFMPVPELFSQLYMVTPNWKEMQALTSELDAMEAARNLSKRVHVYLKGGHREDDPGKDVLFTQEGKEYPFRSKGVIRGPKHGSGCVLSSSITAHLAKGFPLHRACLKAKTYTWHFLNSTPHLLGYHHT